MKKTILFILLFVNFFYANAFTRMSAYRWRNDNGTEITATWKAEKNTPIQINNLDPIRLRVAIEDISGSGSQLGATVSTNAIITYSANGQEYKSLSTEGSPFTLVSSSIVTDGTATTQQIFDGNTASFVAGLFKSTDSNTTSDLPRNNNSFTEHEFCIKPNEQIDPSVTYSFIVSTSTTSSGIPTLTYCPTSVPVPVASAVSPQTFNGNITVGNLQGSGTNLKWYRNITGGSALTITEPLVTGLYYVSQTIDCESVRTGVQVNVKSTALNFNGADSYIQLSNAMPATYTKEAWISSEAFEGGRNIVSGGNDGEHALFVENGILSAGHNSVWNLVADNESLTENTWYHVAVTYDEATTTMKLYKNGNLISSNDNVLPFNNGNTIRIGAFDPNENVFDGSMDEVRVWSKVLSQTEIENNMNCELGGAQTGLEVYYKFNEGDASGNNSALTTVTDFSGNENDGQLNNFVLSGDVSNWTGDSVVQTGKTCAILSVGEHNPELASSLKVYPNPSSNAFFINSDTNGIAVLFDILGKTIQTQKVNSGTTTLNLESVPNGIYLLKVTNENNQSKTVKLIKN
jgi:concanavalin A-like lectin/glucanase superfamily protein/type IX secretion system substrate protein